MKKQFYRLIAAGRGSKTEVLNDDLLQMEKHIEHVRVACQSTCKKLCQCMQTHGVGDIEKRQKRLDESTLSQAMHDASRNLLAEGETNPVLGTFLKICGDAQAGLAKERAMFELFLDDHVVSPLQSLVDVDIPILVKLRERLKKLVIDRDNADMNYQKALRVQTQPTINSQFGATKIESLREELDQAIIKMEQCRDQLVVEMFDYLTKEARHNQRLADFHSKQLDYHRRCLALLENLEPEFQQTPDKTIVNQSYGKALAEHLQATNREIALPIEACVLFLHHFGMKEEGIFRVGGGAAKLRKVRAVLEGGKLNLLDYDAQDDIHAVAGALKLYLRELPDPLLTFELYEKWKDAVGIQDHDEKLREIWRVIDLLPAENKNNFRYLMKFCALVEKHEDINKMSASNLAVVIAPNLLWAPTDDMSEGMVATNLASKIMETVLQYSDYFFPGDIDFIVTPDATFYHTMPSRDSDPNLIAEPPVAPPLPVPMSPSVRPRNKSHSRNSSTEANLSDNTSSVPSKPRKHKSKAPPPPPQHPPPKAQELSKSSAASLQRGSSQENKHPVAAKRISTKKPQVPPPQPPTEEHTEEEHVPRPRARKPPSGSHPPIPLNKPSLTNIPNSRQPPEVHRKDGGTAFSSSPDLPPEPPTPEPRKSSGSTASYKSVTEDSVELHVTSL